jgi:hypothetical protein
MPRIDIRYEQAESCYLSRDLISANGAVFYTTEPINYASAVLFGPNHRCQGTVFTAGLPIPLHHSEDPRIYQLGTSRVSESRSRPRALEFGSIDLLE